MRPGSALLKAATHAVGLACTLEHPADAVLREFFRDHHEIGSHDRAFVAETVYSVLRHKRLLESIVPDCTPHRLVIASLIKLQGLSIGSLDSLLKDQDREWVVQMKRVDVEKLPMPVRLSLPDWIWERLVAQYGEAEATELGRSLLAQAPLDLRVNTLVASRDDVLAELAQRGIEAVPTPYSPVGVRLIGKPAINRAPLYLRGAIEVQDEGSQLLGFLTAPKRREMVVDFCAGAGGKTLLMGALMQSQGRLYAFDVSEKRLNGLKPRLKRSGLSNVHPQAIGSEKDPRIKRLAGKIDHVLVDSPCSGLGTLRRNPDMKWRQTPRWISELVAKQEAILSASAQLLKPGGRLVYATCSLLKEENEDIVAAFLDQHHDFELMQCQEILQNQLIPLECGPYLHVFPHIHGCDGFFGAALRRKTAG
jgi:16S rRNA (cytosine967-C5)-methyltransferase